MNAVRNILGVARYERIMLMRTTRFRVVGLAGIWLPIFLGVVLGILEARGLQSGTTFGIGAFIPFMFTAICRQLSSPSSPAISAPPTSVRTFTK